MKRLPPNHPGRRSPRLPGYDYAQSGAYFVTICTHQREYWFGDIYNGDMILNAAGKIALTCWRDIPAHFPNATLDVFVVMPNHVHGIIFLDDAVGRIATENAKTEINTVGTRHDKSGNVGTRHASSLPENSNRPKGVKSGSLGAIVGSYKSAVTRQIRRVQNVDDAKIWQHSFHDIIIQDENLLNTLRGYVQTNPARWAEDRFYGTA